jgi:urease accessory protein
MTSGLLRLLQLASPALPVGAYTYSQGLEWAVESGAVRDESSALAWIGDCLQWGVARFEAVYLAHMLRAWQDGDMDRLAALDAEFLASRESAELRAETLQMGHSLARLLADLEAAAPRPQAGEDGGARRRERDAPPTPDERPIGIGPLPNHSPACGGGAKSWPLDRSETPSFPLAWSCAAAAWDIPVREALAGYLWAWAENQVMAAVKVVPLGQTAGQRMLWSLGKRIPELAERTLATPVHDTRNFMPAFAIASSLHETQYARIFRS